MNSQQYLNLLTELNALKTQGNLAKGRLYYIGDTKAIAVANGTNEYIPLYENALGSDLAFSADTSKITYKTAFGVEKELSLANLNAATATKLKTKRTIWGQDFDGSANVTGALSGASTGSFSESVTVGTYLTVGSADGSYVQIGALRLVYDATNNAIKLLDPSTTPKNANFYATGSVAAFGPGTVSGGGGTSYNRLDDWGDYVDGVTNDYVLSAELGYGLHTSIENLAFLDSPAFTGAPTAPTPAASSNSNRIATTAFVVTAISNALSSVFTYKGNATVDIINAKGNNSTPVGWAYRLKDSGNINKATDTDQTVDVGDMVICTQANPILWSIIQNNIDTVEIESRLTTVETLLTWILPA